MHKRYYRYNFISHKHSNNN